MRRCGGPLHKGELVDPSLFNQGQRVCRSCSKAYNQKRYALKREEIRAHQNLWRKEHREEYNSYVKKWREVNRDKAKKSNNAYNDKYKSNIANRLWSCAVCRIRKALKGKERKFESLKEAIGTNKAGLKEHMSSLFKPGMGEKNYGQGPLLWEMDHILPVESFDLINKEDQLKCFHYTNLQPLWSKENRAKGSKLNFKPQPTSSHTSKKTDGEDTLRLAC